MTNNSDGKLTERLRAQSRRFPVQGGGSIGTDANGKTVLTSYVTDDGKRLINPDGPAAAALIEQQQATITALVEALKPFARAGGCVVSYEDCHRARAALSLTSSEGGEA